MKKICILVRLLSSKYFYAYTYHYASRVRYLFIRLGVSNAEYIPITWCPVSVIYLLDSALPEPSLYLSLCVRFICVFSKLFLKILSQPTVFDRFFSYCAGIIPRGFRIWLVVGVAIFGDLATINIFYKNGLAYNERQVNCDVTMVLFLNSLLCVGEWEARN